MTSDKFVGADPKADPIPDPVPDPTPNPDPAEAHPALTVTKTVGSDAYKPGDIVSYDVKIEQVVENATAEGPTNTDARSSRPAFSAARRKIEFLITLYSTSLPRSSRRRTVSCSTVKPRASTTTIDAAAFIFSATTSTSSAFLAIIASLISVFTSVIILLGEFFQKKNAPKPRHESTIRFFLHDTFCPR